MTKFMIAGLLLAAPALRAAEPVNIPKERLTETGVRADRAYIRELEGRLESAERGGLSGTVFNFFRAQAWLDFALEEYEENDRGCAVKEALRRALRDIDSVTAARADLGSPASEDCALPAPRADLDGRVAKLKASPGLRCAEELTAKAEVAGYTAAHEESELGWRHSLPSVLDAECLLKGAEEKAAACPDLSLDEDHDGVFDHLDKCPHTPPNTVVDAAGCPVCVDFDVQYPAGQAEFDSVHEAAVARLAAFMTAHPELIVELEGHPDTAGPNSFGAKLAQRRAENIRKLLVDKYGVPPQRLWAKGNPAAGAAGPRGAVTAAAHNAAGDKIAYTCIKLQEPPKDSDGDGVPDYLDKCPGTPRGVAVDWDGCPLCLDMNIQFPSDEAVILPAHSDALAGVADFLERQPDVELRVEGHTDNTSTLAHNKVLSQRRAEAVSEALVARYGVQSRRVTAQGFGPVRPIADNATPEGRALNRRVIGVVTSKDGDVTYSQCNPEKPLAPADADGDGVTDYVDKCPGTPKGVPVDEYGCPSLNLNIQFDVNEATIRPGSEEQLKKLADLLLAFPAATAEIQGHTDNGGSAAANKLLSQARAEAVRKYLVDTFGVDKARLSAKGYGQDKPAVPNDTPEHKQLNRRVVADIDLHQK